MAKSEGIIIEIGGEATPLKKALEGVNKSAKNLQNELKFVDKALKLDPKNTDMVKQKQELLKEAIGNTKEKVDTLKEAQKQMDEKLKNGVEIDQEEYRKLQRQIVFAEDSLKSYKDQYKNVPNTLTRVGDGFTNIGDKSEQLGKKLLPVTGGIVALGTASILAFNDIDEGYDTIIRKTGATGDALNDLYASADNVFRDMPSDMEDVGIAIGEVNTRFGSTGEELEDLSKVFIEFASINETDLNNSIGSTNKIMKAFNIETSETGNLLGLITQKAQDTGISVDSLMKATEENGTVFKEMGLGVEGSVSLLAQFEANGVHATTALAGLKKAQQNAVKEGKPLTEVLGKSIDSIKNAKDETKAMAEAQELFGKKGAAEMVKAIREGRFDLEDLTTTMSEYGSTVHDTFEQTLDGPDHLKQALNSVKLILADIATTIFDVAMPYIQSFGDKLKELSEKFKGLDSGTKETMVKIGALVAGIGPALIVFGKISKVVGTAFVYFGKLKNIISGGKGLTSVLGALSSPVGIVVGAIAGLIAIFVIAYKKSEKFREVVDGVFTTLKDTVKSAWETIEPALLKLKDQFFALVDALKPVGEVVIDILSFIVTYAGGILNGLMQALTPLIDAVTNIVAFVTNIFKAFGALFKGDLDGFSQYMKEALKSLIDAVKNIIRAAIAYVSGFLETFGVDIKGIFTTIKTTISNIWKSIGTFFKETVPEWVRNIISNIQQLPGKFAEHLKKVLSNVKSWATDLISKGKSAGADFLKSCVNAITNLPSGIAKILLKVITKTIEFGTNLVNKGIDIAKKFIKGMVTGISDLPSKFVSVGSDVVKGIWNGINNTTKWIMDKIKGFGDSILSGMKSFFGIHSPSRVMRDEIGVNLGLGVAEGITKSTKKVKKTAQQMGEEILGNAKKTLDNYKVYHDLSLEEEMKFWNTVRKQCKKGTQARIDADKEYYTARDNYKNSLKDNLKEQTEVEKNYKDNVTKIQDDLKASIKSVTDAYEDAVKSRTDAISGSFGIFDQFTKNTEQSGKQLLNNLKSQVDGIAEWKENMDKLAEKGISEELLQELRNMGVKSAGEIQRLTELTDEELQEYSELFGEKNKLAKEIALVELQDLKKETSKEIKSLTKQANADLAEQNQIYNKAMKDLGGVGKAPITQIKAEVKEDGKIIVQTLSSSMATEGKSKNTKSKTGLVATTVTTTLKKMEPEAKLIGANVVDGMINGINSKRDALASAMQSLVNMTIAMAQRAGDIHSPSRKTAKLVGVPLAQGIEVGFKEQMSKMRIGYDIGSSGVPQFALATGNSGNSTNNYGQNVVNIYPQGNVDMQNIDKIVDAINIKLGKKL